MEKLSPRDPLDRTTVNLSQAPSSGHVCDWGINQRAAPVPSAIPDEEGQEEQEEESAEENQPQDDSDEELEYDSNSEADSGDEDIPDVQQLQINSSELSEDASVSSDSDNSESAQEIPSPLSFMVGRPTRSGRMPQPSVKAREML